MQRHDNPAPRRPVKFPAMAVGARVGIVGDHKWTGYEGVFAGMIDTPYGPRPKVLLDDGTECFVEKPHQIAALK